jgi:hypothetical protein
LCEWLTLCPKAGPLPQISHVLGISDLPLRKILYHKTPAGSTRSMRSSFYAAVNSGNRVLSRCSPG